MTEYELEKWCEAHCTDENPKCAKCEVFRQHLAEENNR